MSLPSTRTAAGIGCTSKGPTVPSLSTSTLAANTITSWQNRFGSQCLGSGAPERLNVVAASDCSLLEAVTLCDTLAAGGNMTVNVPAFASNGPYRIGFVKTIASLASGASTVTVNASGVATTLAPGDAVSYIWQTTAWVKISGSGSGASAVPVGQSLFVDSTTGNDATALPYRFDRMYSTVQAAITAAVSGDTVFIYPGTYSADAVTTLKLGVNVTGIDGAASASRATATNWNVTLVTTVTIPAGAGSFLLSDVQVLPLVGAVALTSVAVTTGTFTATNCRFASVDSTSTTFTKSSDISVYFKNCIIASRANTGAEVVVSNLAGTGILTYLESQIRGGYQQTVGSITATNCTIALSSAPVSNIGCSVVWENCVIAASVGGQVPSLNLQGAFTVSANDCTFQSTTFTIEQTSTTTGTYNFRSCAFGNGMSVLSPTGNINISGGTMSGCSVGVGTGLGYGSTFACQGVVFTLVNTFEHAVAGGGRFSFTACTFNTTSSILINQPVAIATQGVTFVACRLGITNVSNTVGCIVYTLGAADTANASQHTFTGNSVASIGTSFADRPLISTAGVNQLMVTANNNSVSSTKPLVVNPIQVVPLMRTETTPDSFTTANPPVQLLIGTIAGGQPVVINTALAAPANLQLPSTANLLIAFGVNAAAGTNSGPSIRFTVINQTAQAITLTAGDGSTTVLAGASAIAANTIRSVFVMLASTTTCVAGTA